MLDGIRIKGMTKKTFIEILLKHNTQLIIRGKDYGNIKRIRMIETRTEGIVAADANGSAATRHL